MKKIGVLVSGLLLAASAQLGLAALPAAAAPARGRRPRGSSSSHHKPHGHAIPPARPPRPAPGQPAEEDEGAQNRSPRPSTAPKNNPDTSTKHGPGASVASESPGNLQTAHPATAAKPKLDRKAKTANAHAGAPSAAGTPGPAPAANAAPSEGLFLLESITRSAVRPPAAVATPPATKGSPARSAAHLSSKRAGYHKPPLADVGAPALSLQTAGHLSIPIFFGVGVALFILLQALVDRRDPKVSRAPQRGDDDTVGFR